MINTTAFSIFNYCFSPIKLTIVIFVYVSKTVRNITLD